jgi:hypothetical protein
VLHSSTTGSDRDIRDNFQIIRGDEQQDGTENNFAASDMMCTQELLDAFQGKDNSTRPPRPPGVKQSKRIQKGKRRNELSWN